MEQEEKTASVLSGIRVPGSQPGHRNLSPAGKHNPIQAAAGSSRGKAGGREDRKASEEKVWESLAWWKEGSGGG